jgi:predicted flavoprotein YhiN
LAACSGIAVDDVGLDLKLNDQRFRHVGRVLITHRGLSGPATLRLSAFAARALHGSRYQGRTQGGLECWPGALWGGATLAAVATGGSAPHCGRR